MAGFTVTAKIHGLEELNRKLAKLEADARDRALKEGLEEAAKPVLAEAKRLVPVDTGRLRDSLDIDDVTITGKGEASIRVLARQSLGGYHAHLIELGTSQQPPQPYLRPAQTNTRGKQRDAFVDVVNDSIDRVAL